MAKGGWKKHIRGRLIRHLLFEKKSDAEKVAKNLREQGWETKIVAETYVAHIPGDAWDKPGAKKYTDYYILKRRRK